MAESRLQRSEIKIESTLAMVVITPEPGRALVRLDIGNGYGVDDEHLVGYPLTPEDAYAIGRSLMEHGTECGYDPDTGETRAVGVG